MPFLGVHKNIFNIGDLSETYWRPIVDLAETHQRPTCFIGDPLETDIPDRRPQYASLETHWRLTCPSKTEILGWRPTYMPTQRLACLIRVLTLFQYKKAKIILK